MEGENKTDLDWNNKYYRFCLYLFVLTFLAIPVAAFLLGNPWLCFGMLFYIIGSWTGWTVIPLLLFSVWTWAKQGVGVSQFSTFSLICSVVGFALFWLARKKLLAGSPPINT